MAFGCQALPPEVRELKNASMENSVASKESTLKNDSSLHPLAKRESWYITGFVENEKGDHFGYYFAVLRQDEHFFVFANVMNLKTGKLILSDKDETDIPIGQRLGINLKIKDAFLRYNDINDSWVFGLDKKSGFNLRLESLAHNDYHINHLEGVAFYSLQSKRVNGQLTIDGKTDFMTAKNAWLTHEWSEAPNQSLTIQRLMCRLYDGRGLMLMRGYKEKKVAFDLALLIEANGTNAPVSQFSVVSQANPSLWEISLLSPKIKFNIETPAPQIMKIENETAQFYSGLVRTLNNKVDGYCLISKDEMEKSAAKKEEKPLPKQKTQKNKAVENKKPSLP